MSQEDTIAAVEAAGDAARNTLAACDDAYYDCDEPIADHLFAYIKQHRREISWK